MDTQIPFLKYNRKENPETPCTERLKNFDEFHTFLSEEKRREQAMRCMHCGIPMCQSAVELGGMITGCPLHNLIPEWQENIAGGHDEHALARLLKTNNFPEFTGAVCPALCEKACINGAYGDAVSIRDNERYLIKNAFDRGWITPKPPENRSGKKVAVIGSGPAGLAVADSLNRRGHQVSVYEQADEIGGLLMYGIPNMKLDKTIIKRRRSLMEAEGISFITDTAIDTKSRADKLKQSFDAVALCCGSRKPRALAGISDQNIPGVCYAVDFLTALTKGLVKKDGHYSPADGHPAYPVKGKNVVIVGGGDTGNDCIATVLRLGCKSVTALEMMPEPPEVRAENNPWPEWPKIKKTDYGHAEAKSVFGKDPRVFQTTVKAVNRDKNGALQSVVTVRVSMQKGKIKEIKGSEKTIPCELLLIAAGFTGTEPKTAKAFGVELSSRGTVKSGKTPSARFARYVRMDQIKDLDAHLYHTTVPGVFSAGDMRRGQSLVVWAIAEGRACAKAIDLYMMGYTV